MATLALGIAGRAAGTVLGGPIGGVIGGAVGALAGGFIDQTLFGTGAALTRASGQSRIEEGPRLAELKISSSSEGAPIPRIYGRMRVAGQLIWATHFEEEQVTTTQPTGGDAPPKQKGGQGQRDGNRSRKRIAGGHRHHHRVPLLRQSRICAVRG